MTPARWIKDGLRIAAIVTLLLAGWWLYSTGYSKAEAAGALQMEALKADYARQLRDEVERQEEAARESKEREAELIARLEEEARKLEETIEDLLHAAEADADAGRVCLSPDSRLRINQVR